MSGGIFILLGTNLGDRQANLSEATRLISLYVTILRKSRVYRTQAWGKTEQPDFYNQVLEVSTSIAPELLLRALLQTELQMGRERKEKWGARQIDIDILFYRNETVRLPQLQIPHPEIQNRRFALVPLCDLAPDFMHPTLNKRLSDILTECADHLAVEAVVL